MNSIDTVKNIFLHPKDFFLKNSGVKQTIFKNIFWLAVAEGISNLLTLLLIIYVARILGATEYGKFTFALAFVTLFAVFCDLGVFSIMIREFSRDKEREKEFSSILSLKILMSLATFLLIFAGSFFVTADPAIRATIWCLGGYIILGSFSGIIFAFFELRQQMEYESLAKVFEALAVVVIGLCIMLTIPSAKHLSYGYLAAELLALFFTLFIFHWKVLPLKISWEKSVWKNILSMSWPLALVVMFTTVYTSIDSVMMGFLGQIIQTGWYNAADKIVVASLIPIALVSASFFPELSVAFKKSKEDFQKVWNSQMEIMVFLGVPLVVGGLALASQIINFMYRSAFSPSILAFQILIAVAGLFYLSNPFMQALIAAGQQRKIFWVSFSGALFNIVLNLFLIPKYSLYGAAAASFFTVFLVLLLFFKYTVGLTGIKPFNASSLSVLACAGVSAMIMYFVISWPPIYHLNTILSVVTGVVVYVFCFFVSKKIIGMPPKTHV